MKKQIAKILSIALITALSVTSFAFAAVTLPGDVEKSNDKALQQAVTGLMEAGAITGDTDGLFHPEQSLTRAQVCKIIVTLAEPIALNGTPTQPLKESFNDLAGSTWAAPYISYAADNGIALGYGDGKFKPAGNVTLAELVTFTVRACGYNDADLGGTWPGNYLKKAEEMKLFTEPADMAFVTEADKTPADMPERMQKQQATKANAAMIIYNAMNKIKKDVAEEQPQGTDKDKVKDVPDTASMVYANASFNAVMTKYGSKDISKDAVVYTYGFKKDYTGDMKFSQKASDYLTTTIDKYKLVKTPAWYKLENGKITQIVVPNDVGFNGYIYCVINDTASAVNADGEKVSLINTLTAMKNIKWLGEKGLDKSSIGAIGAGHVYELKAKDGVITNIAKTDAKLGKQFTELSGSAWAKVLEKDRDMIKIQKSDSSEAWVILKANAAVYNLDGGSEYETGRLSQVKKDSWVRLYDVSDDKEASVDIIVIKN